MLQLMWLLVCFSLLLLFNCASQDNADVGLYNPSSTLIFPFVQVSFISSLPKTCKWGHHH